MVGGKTSAIIGSKWPAVILWLFLLMGQAEVACGQIFSFEQNPPHLKWRQIQSPQFRLIYPEQFEFKAHKMALQIDSLYQLVNADLKSKPRNTAIILQNQSVLPNGFVQLAPRRSEFVTTPPPQAENTDWLQSLTIHELRHVAQFDQLVGSFRAPFFEQLGLAIYGISLPSWYFEGDAVLTETRLTAGGRGRIPAWTMPFRTNLLNGRKFNYQKDYLGSYRDVTPGFYELGYLMVDKLEKDYGVGTSAYIITKMSGRLLRPYNFSRTLRDITGHSSKQWHAETVAELTAKWAQQDSSLYHEDYATFPKVRAGAKESFPENWLLPQAGGIDGAILVLHQGSRFSPEIGVLDEAGNYHKTLVSIGWQAAPNFSARNGRIAWDEIRRNPRYAKQLFSVIQTYDQLSGKVRQLTRNTRLFSPTISPDGQRIACVEVGEDNMVSIVLLDWESGQVLKSIPVPEEIMVQTPSFDASGQKITAIAVSQKGSSILEMDLNTGELSLLIDWQGQQLERPVYWGNQIVFKGHFNGVDNIFALALAQSPDAEALNGDHHPNQVSVHQLTFARFGAFNPLIDESTGDLLFNNYQPEGHRVSRLEQSITGDRSANLVGDRLLFLAGDRLSNLAEDKVEKLAPGKTEFSSEPYSGLGKLLNFHSISLSSDEFSSVEDFKPGLYLLSDNLLNTVQTRVGFSYDGDEGTNEFGATINYQRFFPKIALGYNNRGRTGAVRVINRADNTFQDHKLRWRENHFNLDLRIPLAFYQLNHIYSLNFAAGTSLTQRYGLEVDPISQAATQSFIESVQFPMRYGLGFGHNLRRSLLDLGPRWGQNLGMNYRHFQSADVNNGNINRLFSLWSTFYFPGLARNHSTVLRINYQKGAGTYSGVNDIPMISGFDQLPVNRVTNTVLTSYHLPLAYPDWAIGNLAYIKRIKGGVFADFQNVRPANLASVRPRTFGVELRTDLNLLRYYLPLFDIGAKLIYDNDPLAPGRLLTTFRFGYSY